MLLILGRVKLFIEFNFVFVFILRVYILLLVDLICILIIECGESKLFLCCFCDVILDFKDDIGLVLNL